ncbi:MAG TPA: pilus assembly protein PilM [Candidatus Saccharimonadales bacterium]|nr:pilus assembly protein PilM [Candidatus Saccharimonadales bacterium]
MSAGVVGVDIAYEAVKICGLVKKGARYQLIGLNWAAIPKDSWGADQLKNRDEIARVLVDALKTAKPEPIKTTAAVVALPETAVYSATFSMPALSRAELTQALPFEIGERLAINPDEYYFDYETLSSACQPLGDTVGSPAGSAPTLPRPGPTTDAGSKTKALDSARAASKTAAPSQKAGTPQMAVFAVAAKRTLVDSVIDCLHQAGLTVSGIDIKAGAIINALLPRDDKKMRLIVDLGAGTTGIAVGEGKAIHLISSVPIGTRGLGDNDLAGFQQVAAPIFDELVHATKFFENRMCPGRKIEEIIIIGGSATITGLSEFFTTQTGLKTVVGNPFGQIDTHRYPIPDEFIHKFADSIGCAMRKF